MEEARVLGELMKAGWKPKEDNYLLRLGWWKNRGLIGSTEWVEHHGAELQQKAVAYINSDGNGRGFLYVQGSHTLEKMMGELQPT